MAYRLVDLFCGCGGMSLGFERAGFSLVGAFDSWEAAARVHEDNLACPVTRADLSQPKHVVDAVGEMTPDIIVGGPPCQDFSHAGKKQEAGRAALTVAYAQIVAAVHPAAFVMENVPRCRDSQAYAQAREIYVEAGYGLTERVLSACRCGVPQMRKRFIVIGILGAPDKAANLAIERHLAKTDITLRDYLGDELGIDYYYVHPRNYQRRAIFSVDEVAPTMRGQNRPMPKNYRMHERDACAPYPGLRALTAPERARIQTFPASFAFTGTKTDVEQMIGNAVPPEMARLVGECLLETLEG